MKKIFSVLAIMMIAVASVFAADDKKVSVIDKNVPVEYFNKIVLKGSDKIIFTQGDKPSVRIHGIKEMVDAVVVNQDGKTLTVSRNSSFNNGEGFAGLWNALKNETIEVVIYVTSPDLIDVQLTGSGDIEVVCSKCDKVNASLQGSGDITVVGQYNRGDSNERGSGDINWR